MILKINVDIFHEPTIGKSFGKDTGCTPKKKHIPKNSVDV